MSFELHCESQAGHQTLPLGQTELRIGRGPDNDLVLPDPAVSRNHALLSRRGAEWWLVDLGSTNGLEVNGEAVLEARLRPGDRVLIGPFRLEIAERSGQNAESRTGQGPGVERALLSDSVPHTRLVRPLAEAVSTFGLGEPGLAAKRSELDAAYGNRVFGYLLRLAGLLLTIETVEEVLRRVVEIAFEALPVRRGFVLLFDSEGQPICELARFEERVVMRPSEAVPISRTIVARVLEEKVALITLDAQSDNRLALGASVHLHDIRAAMSVPLWSGERIIGLLQVDSPLSGEVFTEQDLDFLTALANYAAVAVERLRNREAAEREQRLTRRLERYHSPAVIEAVLGREGAPEELGRLAPAEVTVLFVDLVGFSTLAERSAPEEVASLLEEFFDVAVEAIFEAGGTLDKFIGDCVMAFFGAPFTQPDHASRAVGAALAIQRGLARANRRRGELGRQLLSAHIGLMSGQVVVGEVGSSRRVDYTVLGNTVNIAARLTQEVAEAGEIVLGASTYTGAAATVEAESLGPVALTGLASPVVAYRVRVD